MRSSGCSRCAVPLVTRGSCISSHLPSKQACGASTTGRVFGELTVEARKQSFRGAVRRAVSLVYMNDQRPPHVHVVGPEREAKVALGGEGERPSVVLNEGLSSGELADALVEIDRNRDLLMQRWREIHGDA